MAQTYWQSSLVIEGATAAQIAELQDAIERYCESVGITVGGGFLPADADGVPLALAHDPAARAAWAETVERQLALLRAARGVA